MKVKVQAAVNILLMSIIAVASMSSAGCFYPKAERGPGELVSDINFKIIDETTIVGKIGNGIAILSLSIFILGLLFSILLMVGYRTKISHFIVGTIIISIHVAVTKVGNSGDMFLNCMLVWTFFLPLGKSISIDSLIKSLKKYKENDLDELNNNKLGINVPKQIYSIAYFEVRRFYTAIHFSTVSNHRTSYFPCLLARPFFILIVYRA